jgi:4-alpha-glucanotransferase
VQRHAGLLVPLFSAASSRSWGIGELPDLLPLSRWLSSGGFDRLLLLPLGTMAPGQHSPYTASSAMSIDPIFIAVEQVEAFARAGGLAALSNESRRGIETARSSRQVQHDVIRQAKTEALDRAFAWFVDDDWAKLTTEAASLAAYIAKERYWLDDYALFQALTGTMPDRSWRAWPAELRDRDPRALGEARRALQRDVLKHQYLQWVAESQWQRARAAAAEAGVVVVGDLPFTVNEHSPDIWARPDDYLLDVNVGAPPDAFSATGQDWGVPTYRWESIHASDFAWLRLRARRMASLYGGFRVDHLVGFYRTYGRPKAAPNFFTPADEPTQLWQGESVLKILLATGAAIMAEDLGTVPDFVRASLERLDIPGYKVMRWERAWHDPGQPFIDPAGYPAVSIVTTGTHDTEMLAGWWDAAPRDERAAAIAMASMKALGVTDPDAPWSDRLRDAWLQAAYRAGSRELFLPVQDVFGWRDRINEPATITEDNWTWRLPWAVDRLEDAAQAVERAAFCRRLAREAGRH